MTDEKIQKIWDELKTQRDELRVQMHLAKAEMKEEWGELEKNLDVAQDKLEEVVSDAGEAAKEVQAVAKVIGEEMSEAYNRIKARLAQNKHDGV